MNISIDNVFSELISPIHDDVGISNLHIGIEYLKSNIYNSDFEEFLNSNDINCLLFSSYLIREIDVRLIDLEPSIFLLSRSPIEYCRSSFHDYCVNFLLNVRSAYPAIRESIGDDCATVRARGILWLSLCAPDVYNEIISGTDINTPTWIDERKKRCIKIISSIRNGYKLIPLSDEDPYIKFFLKNSTLKNVLRFS